jgi:hypothetical protein
MRGLPLILVCLLDQIGDKGLMVVSLNMVLTYPPTYPDVAPEITFETIEDDEEEEEEGNGELTEEEEETVLEQLNTIVCPLLSTRQRMLWVVLQVKRKE